ncbi:diguanylate cyclase, partial [bacterium]|nr:diguanylate cyclase [bacterium]
MAQIQAFMAFGALALRVWQALLAPVRMLLPACRLLCLGFALLASTCAWAQTPVDLSVTDSGTLRLDKANVRYLEDGNGQLVIDDITALDASVWQVVEQDTVSFGYSQSAYWLSFKVSNTSAELFQGVVAVAAPLLDEVSLYNVSAGQVAAEYHVGNELPFAQRPYPHRHFIFPVTLPAQSEKQLYLRVRSKSSLQITITLAAETQYFLNDQNEFMIKSMYYGMMLIMALYNFFLFLATREKAYLYYVGFVSAFALLQATMHGMLYQFLYPGSVWLSQVSTTFLIPATAFFALLFPMRFLRMKRISGRLYFVCKVGVALSCVLMVVSLFFRTYASYFVSMVLVLVTCFVIMTSAFVAMYKGQKSARYFIIAWAMLLVGTTVIALTKFGFLPRNLFTENGLTFGSAIEAVLLSFALADRLNQERLARSRAQNDKLREMSEREKIENELIYQMTHHSVSGLPNAVMLKRSMEALFQQASSYSNVVALVLIKLRNYNDINKTLGHANGDIAIEMFSRRLSSICAEQSNRISIEEREGDRFFTASLEKNLFAFLLAVDSEDNINEQVDDMVARLSQPLELKDLPLDVNVSAGISLYPEYATDSTTLLRQAHAAIDSGDRSVSHLIVTYSPDIDARNQRKMMLMGELRGAIESTS